VLPDRDRAAALARKLAAGGFSPRTITTRPAFRVVSEPLPRNAADGLSATLTARGFRCSVQPLTSDTAQVLFGTFTTQKEADALAQRVEATGYDAWVRGSTVFVLEMGQNTQSTIDTMTGVVRSDAPDATITITPTP